MDGSAATHHERRIIRGFIHLGSLVFAGLLVAVGVLAFLFPPSFL